MAKTKPMTNAGGNPKQSLKTLKHGAIQKKKNPKYKMTPTGKVNLINGPKAQNNHKNKQQKQFQKGISVSPEKSPKHNNRKNKQSQSPQSPANQKKLIKQLVPENDEYDSDSDYNEGITLQEEVSMVQDGSMEEVDDSDDDVPDIFGTSLAEESDDDDEDFDEDDSDEEEEEDEKTSPKENKGVKMFGGVKQQSKSSESKSSDESFELDTSASAKSSSMVSNDDDDDDEEEDDEDEDENEEDEEDNGDDEDADENEDEEEDEDDEEECGPGLKDLLSNSLVDDDDDDEDFKEDGEDSEDEDMSDEDEDEEANNSTVQTPEKKSNEKEDEDSPNKYEKENSRTIFVGNLPVNTKKEQLKKLFKKYGPILAVRLRGIVPVEEKIPKKVAAITKQIHPKLKEIYGYVVFKNEESVKEAMAMNGQLYEGHYLRVDSTVKAQESDVDPKKSVFLGNLSFKVDNNAVWEHFKDCGEIESVRIVKHNKTGLGKGIGYVNFKNEDSVALALKLDGTELQNREIRVKRYSKGTADSKSKDITGKKRNRPQKSSTENLAKKFKTSLEKMNQKQEKKGQHSQGNETSPQNKTAFQGQKADLKKKKKQNKLDKQKKIIAAKLTAKPKKPMH